MFAKLVLDTTFSSMSFATFFLYCYIEGELEFIRYWGVWDYIPLVNSQLIT